MEMESRRLRPAGPSGLGWGDTYQVSLNEFFYEILDIFGRVDLLLPAAHLSEPAKISLIRRQLLYATKYVPEERPLGVSVQRVEDL